MAFVLKRFMTLAACAASVALLAAVTISAQTPPARGMRWSKAAPFPEPEEELYGTVINGKFYVVGGFGFNPGGVANAALPAGRGGAAPAAGAGGGRGAAATTNQGPCGGCPPGLI